MMFRHKLKGNFIIITCACKYTIIYLFYYTLYHIHTNMYENNYIIAIICYYNYKNTSDNRLKYYYTQNINSKYYVVNLSIALLKF